MRIEKVEGLLIGSDLLGKAPPACMPTTSLLRIDGSPALAV